jgi:hypothetical protein
MNTHDFWMLGTGVVITLVFTGTVKWLFRLFDAVVPVSQAPDRLRAVMSIKPNRTLLWSSLATLFQIVFLIRFALDKSPITRFSIINGAMMVVAFWFAAIVVRLDIRDAMREHQRAKEEAAREQMLEAGK